jgi:hypothetical protein
MGSGDLDRADPATYWGAFENGRRTLERADPGTYVPGEVQDVVAVRCVWNHRELFARTTDAYVLFSWSTGA